MSNYKKVIDKIHSNSVYIWGARMTGLGALRILKQAQVNVVGFIDSDNAFANKIVAGLPVIAPSLILSEVKSKEKPVILVAVSLKESEIREQLQELQCSDIPVYSFQDIQTPYYTIDILSSCNLKCASCPHSIENHGTPKGSMTLETIKKVIDKIKTESPAISHVSLYSWGEPLLHPYIDQVVEYIHSKNIAVALSSNLSINFDERLENLVKTNPEYLKISLSGYYPTAYSNTHQGGDINLVKSNLYRLRYLIDKYKSTTLVDINYHLYRDNAGKNIEKFRELANELRFILSETYALVMPLERVLGYYEGKIDYQTSALEKNLLVGISEGVNASSKIIQNSGTCPFRENQININADLSVPVCCTVFSRDKNIVGINYLKTSIAEITDNKKNIDICTKCMNLRLPEYNMGFNRSEWERIANSKEVCDVGDVEISKLKSFPINK